MSEVRQTLKVNNFEVWVHLGCSAEEQYHSQPVLFSLEIKFLKNLPGSQTDQLKDAVDYVALTEMIKRTAQQKSFQLIEHLNQSVFDHVIASFRQQHIFAEVSLNIRKIRVPVENLKDGVEFTCYQLLS